MKTFRSSKKLSEPRYLDSRLLDRPASALYLASLETKRCGRECDKLSSMARSMLVPSAIDKSHALIKNSNEIMELCAKVSEWLDRLLKNSLMSKDQNTYAVMLKLTAGAIETAADSYGRLAEQLRDVRRKNLVFPAEAESELDRALMLAGKHMKRALSSIAHGDRRSADTILSSISMTMDQLDLFNDLHISRLDEHKKQKEHHDIRDISRIYESLLSLSEKIISQAAGIAEAAAYGLSFDDIADMSRISGEMRKTVSDLQFLSV